MRAYTVTVDDKQIDLRITIASQMKLAKKYNEPCISTILGSVSDPAKIVDVLDEAVKFKGNENEIKSGIDLYDALVDCGYAGTTDFIDLLVHVAYESGLITEEQMDSIAKYTKSQSDKIYKEMADDGDTSKNG